MSVITSSSINYANNSIYQRWFSLIFFISGISIGLITWGNGSGVGQLGLLLLLPFFWGLASSRLSASILVLGYFLASARGLPGGTAVFFGAGAPSWVGFVFWFFACIFLSLPFVVLWSASMGVRPWRFVLAVCVSIVPPLGLIGWVNPISAAGVYFPGLGWLGLMLILGLMAALITRHAKWIFGLGLIALIANLISLAVDVRVPTGWQSMDTQFSGLSSAGGNDAGQILAGMKRVEWVKQYAESIPANCVRVLPETVLGSYSGVSEFALMEVNESLAARGSRLLVGAELPKSDGRYLNAVIVLGATGGDGLAAVQGVPVPVSMWKPWASDGAVANIFGHGGVVMVKNVRAGVLVCYEQLLSYSVLRMMLERPSVIVGAANVWWVKDPSIPAIQGQMLGVFGRLFGVGVMRAVNY
ncbi:MAG: hypothetical protein U1E13_14855 [Methylophilaceae bacterium]|nr:hypothetical protein [Methylophilaceae bacterium]